MKNSAIILLFLCFNLCSYASIVYTDIEDETFSLSGDQYLLDLDNNSVTDFKIALSYPSSKDHNQVTLIHQGENRAGVETVLPWLGKLAWNLEAGIVADADLETWMTSGAGSPNEIFLAYYAGPVNAGGAFIESVGFLPLEFEIDGAIHYGWVRLEVNDNSTEFTVMDFAYESISNTAIAMGDQGNTTHLTNLKDIELSVYPNPSDGIFSLNQYTSEFVGTEMIILDSKGKLILNIPIESNETLVNLRNQPSGIYFVKFANQLENKTYRLIKI